MTARKTTAAKEVEVEEVEAEEVEAEEVEAAEAPAPAATPAKAAPAKAVEEVEVKPATVSFTAPNTWTAFYGGKRFDFIEGKKYNLAPEIHAWFSRK